jgi:hypothetical protein
MTPLTALVVPVVVSAVVVFFASFVLHMLIEAWHRHDLDRLPDEDGVRAALRPFRLAPGNYAMPLVNSVKEMNSPEFVAKMKEGPVAFLTVRQSGPPSMSRELTFWFIFTLVVSLFAGYIASRALAPGAVYLDVFRYAGTTAFAAYGLGQMQEAIWWGRKWSATVRNVIDGLIYALLTAGVFGWLWPAS